MERRGVPKLEFGPESGLVTCLSPPEFGAESRFESGCLFDYQFLRKGKTFNKKENTYSKEKTIF